MLPSRKSGSQQDCFQFEERGQKLVRFNDESASIAAMRVNDVMRSICGRDTAIAPRPTRRNDLVSDDLPVFHLLMCRTCSRLLKIASVLVRFDHSALSKLIVTDSAYPASFSYSVLEDNIAAVDIALSDEETPPLLQCLLRCRRETTQIRNFRRLFPLLVAPNFEDLAIRRHYERPGDSK